MAKKKYKTKEEESKVSDPQAGYERKRITFSTLETQGDIQLKYAMDATPVERLAMMRKLNDYAYKNLAPEKLLTEKTRLIFSSYEYISG
jgi:hypothetical protein